LKLCGAVTGILWRICSSGRSDP